MTPTTLGPWESNHPFNEVMQQQTQGVLLKKLEEIREENIGFVVEHYRNMWAAIFDTNSRFGIALSATFPDPSEDNEWFQKKGTLQLKPCTAKIDKTEWWIVTKEEVKTVPFLYQAHMKDAVQIQLENHIKWKKIRLWVERNADALVDDRYVFSCVDTY